MEGDDQEEHARPAFFLAHIDRYALLVATYTAKPRTRPIDIEFAPHAQRIPAIWRLDLDDFRAKMPGPPNKLFPMSSLSGKREQK
jgi:hypothetical protein